ncbi:MAG: hypothetical protein QGD93_11220, partial [Actinomycetota bacterium]|nr:hypothetical protein [Actinomycetota bacterium]
EEAIEAENVATDLMEEAESMRRAAAAEAEQLAEMRASLDAEILALHTEMDSIREETSELRAAAMADVARMREQAAAAREQIEEVEDSERKAATILDTAKLRAGEIGEQAAAEAEEAELRFSAARAAKDEAESVLKSARDEAELIRIESSTIQDQARMILDAAREQAEELADAEETAFGLVEQAQREAVAIRSKAEGEAASAGARIEELEAGSASTVELEAEIEGLHTENATLKITVDAAYEAATSHGDPETVGVEPAHQVTAQTFETTPSQGTSLRDRIGAAQGGETGHEGSDSLEAIRLEAMRALVETQSLQGADTDDAAIDPGPREPAPSPVYDYSPSVPAPKKAVEDDEKDEDEGGGELVENRYARNSAKLPRLGIEPESASSTIADLRRQMTAGD